MSKIAVTSKTFEHANILQVTVGTNCPAGGDSGHGGRTLFRIKDLGGTDMSVRIDGGELQSVGSLDIILGGDSECATFMQALEHALGVLRAQSRTNGDAFSDEEIG